MSNCKIAWVRTQMPIIIPALQIIAISRNQAHSWFRLLQGYHKVVYNKQDCNSLVVRLFTLQQSCQKVGTAKLSQGCDIVVTELQQS